MKSNFSELAYFLNIFFSIHIYSSSTIQHQQVIYSFFTLIQSTNFQAVLQEFGKLNLTFLPQSSIGACFQKLNTGEADYAVVPLENSTNGQVVFTYDLLRDWFMPSETDLRPSFSVVSEQFVPIHHNVLTNAKDLSLVTKVYSHPQVWGQVTAFMNNNDFAKKWATIDAKSTADAARIVAQDSSNTTACISSVLSAELYGLPIAVPNVEDRKENTTRFLVLARSGVSSHDSTPSIGDLRRYITSLMFMLNHNDPGALCDALDSFRRNSVNLHSIASRPSGRAQWEYVFFVEVEGHSLTESVHNSIEALQRSCTQTAVLGLFVREYPGSPSS